MRTRTRADDAAPIVLPPDCRSCFDAGLPERPKGDPMTRVLRALVPTLALLAPAAAFAQVGIGAASTPLAVDLKKVPVGAWAEYSMTIGPGGQGMTMKSRWSLVAKD